MALTVTESIFFNLMKKAFVKIFCLNDIKENILTHSHWSLNNGWQLITAPKAKLQLSYLLPITNNK